MTIAAVETGLYRIELPVPLSDSTHGLMTHFELVTVRLRDTDGAEGIGYTYTTGAGGVAVHALIDQGLRGVLEGADPARIESLWQKMWWKLHYGGRGGSVSLAVSACDIALYDLKARRLGTPLWRLLGGFDPAVPCYAGGIDLEFTLDALLKQTDDNLAKGFRAIKMKVGRARLSEDRDRVFAMRKHLGDDFPLMADANMKWTVDESIRAARTFRDANLTWLEEPTIPRRRRRPRPYRAGGRRAHRHRRKPPHPARIHPNDIGRRRNVPRTRRHQLRRHHRLHESRPSGEAFNLPLTSHGAHDLTVHLLAATPNRSYLEVHGFGLDRYILRPMPIREGKAYASETPGHGVAFDWDALAKTRVA